MKQCKQGYYYCHTDKKCKRIPLGYRVASSGYLRKENDNSSDDNENDSNNSNGNGNGGNGSGSGNGGSNGGGMSEGSLHKWFKGSKSKDGKGGWVNVVTGGTCASDEPGEGTPKCVSSSKRASMTKAERKSAARRKKTKDPGQQQKSGAAKPTYVSTDKKKMKKEEVEIIEAKDKKSKGSGKKDACYHKVKSRYSVWPSAYASGALVKCRKKGAANWGNKSEEWVANTAAEYFFNEGINEYGLSIFIEELGVENFVGFVHDLIEDSELTEAYALTDKKKTPKRLPKGTQPAKTTKATISRGDSKIKAASPSGAFKKRPAAAKAVETAKAKQPEKKPVKSTLVKSVADTLARGALSAWKGHQTAMKKKKEGASVAKQVGAGLGAAAGAMLKKGKKHLSDDYKFSNWRDDFQATEYEFIDIIKAEPLISESPSFEIKKTTEVQGPEVPKERQWGAGPASKRTKEGIDRLKKKLKKEEVETVDELKCWKGYKRKKGSVPGAKGSCVKAHVELEGEHIEERKDDTEIGFTGKPIPKKNWKSPNKRHEFEKKRRKAGFTSKGSKYKSDVNPYYNPLQKNHVELEGEKIEEEKEESKIDGSNLKKLVAKAVRRVDADVDGDVDTDDMKSSETGVFVPSPDGKKLKPKVRFEGASDWRNELDEGWKSALAGAGVAAALMSQGGQKAPDKKTTTSPSRSNTERVSKTTQKTLSPMDKWRKNHPELAKKSDNPSKFNRKKLSPINKDWAKANPKLAEKEKDNRSKLGEGAAWTKKSGKNKSGGLNEKGRKSYEAENPGSDLKAPSKKVGNKRRASFCARMKGMRKRQKPSNNTGDDRLSKSLRAWNC